MQDPNYVAAHFEKALRHLRGDEVTPGFEVNVLSQNDYQERMTELGDDVQRAAGPPEPDS